MDINNEDQGDDNRTECSPYIRSAHGHDDRMEVYTSPVPMHAGECPQWPQITSVCATVFVCGGTVKTILSNHCSVKVKGERFKIELKFDNNFGVTASTCRHTGMLHTQYSTRTRAPSIGLLLALVTK